MFASCCEQDKNFELYSVTGQNNDHTPPHSADRQTALQLHDATVSQTPTFLNFSLVSSLLFCREVFLVVLVVLVFPLQYSPTPSSPHTRLQVSERALCDKVGDVCDVDPQLQQLPAVDAAHRQRVVHVLAAPRVDAEHQVSLPEVPPLCHLDWIHPPRLLGRVDWHLSQLRTGTDGKLGVT